MLYLSQPIPTTLSCDDDRYSETIPYYICTIEQGDCIKACGAGNNDCAGQCRKTHVCGATSPRKLNTTLSASGGASSTGGSSPEATGSDNGEGFASTGGDSGNNNSGAAGLLLRLGSACGLGLAAAGIAVGVAFVGL